MAKSKREFGEGPIYTITNYIFWFFLGNLYFMLLNIPLLMALVVLASSGSNPLPPGFIFVFILCCIPVGPAITALLSVMGKLIREKEINITKDFFKAYKTNFFQSLIFGTIELIIISILLFDTRFLVSHNYPQILISVTYVIISFIFLISLHAFPIMSRFYLSLKDIVKLASYYTIRKFHITVLNCTSFIVAGFILYTVSSVAFIVMWSIICYMIMFYERKILIEIEDTFLKNTEKSEE
ncbi:YesL family protein [Clostridium sp.]|uniref:YesL family protein n=1 Tax=Clostridium sp. TaxID=1506 RepID=UPI003D6CEE72